MSKSNKTVSEKTAELAELVAWFDSDDFSLEAAIEKFQVAEKLAAEIESDLKSLQNEIVVVKQKFDGQE